MKQIEEVKESLKNKLSSYGIEFSNVKIDNNFIEIDEHELDMDSFYSKIGINLNSNSLTIQKNEYGLFIMDKNRDLNEEMYEKFYEELSQIKQNILKEINEITGILLSLHEFDFTDKKITDLIDNKIHSNLIVTDSLSSVKNWKAKIILGNSRMSGKEIGDFNNVGYVCVGINTGTIVPISRSDEHNRGLDLVNFFKEKSLIAEDIYIPIYIHGHYVDCDDMFALAAFKIWRKLGGPNVVLNSWSKENKFQITMDDYIKMNGSIIANKGTLLPIGREFIDLLNQVAQVNSTVRENPNNLPKMITATKKLIRYIATKVDIFLDVAEMTNLLKEAIESENPQQKIEEFVFGFNGIKNKYHNKIRKEIDQKGLNHDMESIFGDLELANHEFSMI